MHLPRTFFIASLMLALPVATATAQQAPAGTASPAAEDPMSDKARELFNEGKKLFRDGKYGPAEASFEAAWALALKSKGIAANLGECEMRLGKNREAAEHLAISVRLAQQDDPQRAKTVANLAAVKAKIGTLNVSANVSAEVLVDGKKVGDTPLLDPIFVEPGKVKVRVRQEGYTSWEKELDVAAGQEVPLDVKLEKPAPIPTVTATTSATATAPPPPNRVPSYVAFGVGGVGLLLGAITGGASLAAFNDVRTACGDLAHCPETQRGAVSTGGTLADLSTAGFVVAGVGAAVGVTLWLVPIGRSSSTRAAVSVGPSSISVKGAF